MTEQKKQRRAIRQQLIRTIKAESGRIQISKGLAKRWTIYRLAHPK